MTEHEQEASVTPVSEFNEAVAAINEYNQEFSGGRALGKSLFDIMTAHLPPEALEDREKSTSFADEKDMTKGILELSHSPTLSLLGLRLTPMRAEATIFSGAGTGEIGPVRLQIEDGDKFGDFLQSAGAVTDEAFKNNVQKVLSAVLNEVSDSIINHTDGESVVETLASTEKILTGLERLGLAKSEAAKRLKEYSDHSKKGDLAEYVLGVRLQLFQKPEKQGFGPSGWQMDATPEYLQRRWDEVISLLRKAKANPNGSDIFNELSSGAKASLEFARRDWQQRKARYISSNSNQASFDGVFNEVAARIYQLETKD